MKKCKCCNLLSNSTGVLNKNFPKVHQSERRQNGSQRTTSCIVDLYTEEYTPPISLQDINANQNDAQHQQNAQNRNQNDTQHPRNVQNTNQNDTHTHTPSRYSFASTKCSKEKSK